MKKIYILAICLLVAGAAQAQNLSFGVKGGLNYSNIIKTGDDDFNTEFKPGFHAGIFLEVPLVSSFSIAPELVFSQKGYKASGSSLLGGDYEYNLTSNFIELPILAKINASDQFSIVLGPQVSFLTSTTEEFKSGSDAFRRTIEEENDNLKKSLFGGVAGFNVNLGSKLGLMARYAIDFQQNNPDGSTETPEFKNQVFQAGLSLKF